MGKKNYASVFGKKDVILLNPSRGTVKRWISMFPDPVYIVITSEEFEPEYIDKLHKIMRPVDRLHQIKYADLKHNCVYYCGFTFKKSYNPNMQMLGYEINPKYAQYVMDNIVIEDLSPTHISVRANRSEGYQYAEVYNYNIDYNRYCVDLVMHILKGEKGYRNDIMPLMYNIVSTFDLPFVLPARVKTGVHDALYYFETSAVEKNDIPVAGAKVVKKRDLGANYFASHFDYHIFTNEVVVTFDAEIIPCYSEEKDYYKPDHLPVYVGEVKVDAWKLKKIKSEKPPASEHAYGSCRGTFWHRKCMRCYKCNISCDVCVDMGSKDLPIIVPSCKRHIAGFSSSKLVVNGDECISQECSVCFELICPRGWIIHPSSPFDLPANCEFVCRKTHKHYTLKRIQERFYVLKVRREFTRYVREPTGYKFEIMHPDKKMNVESRPVEYVRSVDGIVSINGGTYYPKKLLLELRTQIYKREFRNDVRMILAGNEIKMFQRSSSITDHEY